MTKPSANFGHFNARDILLALYVGIAESCRGVWEPRGVDIVVRANCGVWGLQCEGIAACRRA